MEVWVRAEERLFERCVRVRCSEVKVEENVRRMVMMIKSKPETASAIFPLYRMFFSHGHF